MDSVGGSKVTGGGVTGAGGRVLVGEAADGAGRPDAVSTAPGGLRRVLAGAKWYWSSVMGDNLYERYLAHHARTHPGETPLTKRAYWRERTDDQDRNPGTRCC